MKRVRLLITLALMLVAVSVSAQDSYSEALKDYLKITEKQASEKMLAQLHQLNPMLFEYKQDIDFNQLASRYVDEQLLKIKAEKVQDMFKEVNVTESDIRQMTALMTTPQGETLIEHGDAWSDQFEEILKEEMEEPLKSVFDGTPISSTVVANSDIPASYARKFMQYFEDTRGMDQFANAFSQPLKMMGIEVPESLLEWMKNNLGTLAMNSAYGIITEDDLDYSANLQNYDFHHKIVDATVKMSENVISMGMDIILNYIDWMKGQGVSVSKMGEGAIESFKKTIEVE